ncbi:ankyrin 1 [Halorhodospira halochloris]|uniref:Ankyrin 1 n=1 Tax=Halorhodospira halochloris TaxID=1052 RepID=A0A120MZK7_HALHR|nr:ankyrin 1 [Halorhodospira halochloris]
MLGLVLGHVGGCALWQPLNGGRDAIEAIRAADQSRLEEALEVGDLTSYTDQVGRNLLHYAAVHGQDSMLVSLLEYGISPNKTDNSGRLPLHYALESDLTPALADLLEATQRVDQPDEQGLTPLMLAARNGQHEVVEKLLAAGADPDRRDELGATALSLAAAADHPRAVSILRQVTERPPSAYAAADVVRAGDVETLNWMIEHGLDIWATWEESGQEMNLAAVAVDSSPQAAALLMRYGAGLDATGDKALVAVALRGDVSRVKELLAAGADPNAEVPRADAAGRKVLMEVSRLGLVDTAMALIEAGADPQLADEHGADSLWHAAVGYISRRDRAAGLERGSSRDDILLALLEAGASPSGGDRFEFTPLHAAAAWGSKESVQALLDAGAALESTDRNGRTPLVFAAQFGNAQTLQELIDSGADPSAVSYIGSSVVTYARLADRLAGDGASGVAELVRSAGGGKSPGPRSGTPSLSVSSDERRVMRLDQPVAVYDSADPGGSSGRFLPYTTTCSGISCIYPPVVVLPAGTVVELIYREAGSSGRLHSIYMVQESGLRGFLFEDDLYGAWPPAGAAASELTVGRVAHIRGMRWVEEFDVNLTEASGGLIW